MMDRQELILITVIICVCIFIFSGVIASRADKRRWNNGHCTCGGKWHMFDVASDGSRGYKCSSCGTYIWISYKVDKGYGENE